MKNLYIFGAGGFGREVAWLIERINKVQPTWNIVGFLDDAEEFKHQEVNGYTVLGGSDYFESVNEECWVVCTIGASKIRKKVVEKISKYDNVRFATLIDPSAIISNSVELGEGTILCAGTIATVNINIGTHVILNLDCTVGHDVILKDFVTVYPSVNISGNVMAGECVELGTGTQIIQGKEIGEETIVGAGAVVVKNLPAKCTAVGAPAKPIKFHENIKEDSDCMIGAVVEKNVEESDTYIGVQARKMEMMKKLNKDFAGGVLLLTGNTKRSTKCYSSCSIERRVA